MTRRKTPIWQAIADTLKSEIADGIYASGDKLPTEAVLSKRFGVNRHTVRHALSHLGEAGLVVAKRGAGVFVTGTPTEYPLGKRVRFHRNVRAAGRLPTRELLSSATRRSTAEEAEALHLQTGDPVHAQEGISLVDGVPVTLFQGVFPAERFPDLLPHLEEGGSVTQSLRAVGVEDYTRVSTRLTAKLATATQAGLLRIAEGAPLLRSVSVNAAPDGIPIEFGKTWFVGERMTLTLQED